ncbi:hypothetical protein [Plantactinospora endophytica]|uniref:Gram-positive cocci surface proteins LPxTG domain-containing protein n=1 Tax=Plantactinospora endophytica TaxID=673535 RepID=A0ABQ4E6T0_9ACTN|nr:hypothetical protein [Plantactinospora endophytica]GIG90378.1 hypothetical protein Pen02_53140 [Plantactinospora endophytica]
MQTPPRRLGRTGATLLAVALTFGAGMTAAAMVALTPPAQAAPSLGTLTISPTSGSVTEGTRDAPAFTAGTSAACPAGSGAQAQLRISPAGQPGRPAGGNLARIASDTNYDRAPFTLRTDRSIARALDPTPDDGNHPAPADGDYRITVECMTELAEVHEHWFQALVTISGPTWQVKQAPSGSPTPTGSADPTPTASPTATPTASPTASPTPTPTEPASPTPTPTETASPTPTPTETASPTPTPTESESPSPSPSQTEGGGGGNLALTGTSLPTLLTGGLVLVVVGVAAMLLARRRDHP